MRDPVHAEQPYTLPDTGFIRQKQLVNIIPFSRTTLWRKVKDGEFPVPVRLSAGITVWKVEEVRAWIKIEKFSEGAAQC